MSQNDLLKTLEEDVRRQRRVIVEEAEESAKKLLEEAEAEAVEFRERKLKEIAKEIEDRRGAALNMARIRARALRLSARTEIIEEVFKRALKEMEGLAGEERAALLSRLYEELKAGWPLNERHERPIVYMNPKDVELLEHQDDFEVRPSDEVSGGLVFSTSDGRVRMDNTLVSRLRRARRALVPIISRTLFGE